MARHVFLSYVREDSLAVDRLQQALEAAGIPVWRDTHDLWPGDDWRVKIRQAITDHALVFVACFSDQSEAREISFQREELMLAVDQVRLRHLDRAWLIPVRLSDCPLPQLDLGAGRTLGAVQWVDVFGDKREEGTRRLVAGVQRIMSSAPVPRQSSRLDDLPEQAILQGTASRIDWPITVPRQERHVLRGFGGLVTSICAAPVDDRMRIAAGGADGRVRLWDPITGQLDGEFLVGDLDNGRRSSPLGVNVRSVHAIQDGDKVLLATSGEVADLPASRRHHVVWLWDPLTGQLRGEPLIGHTDQVLTLCSVPVGGRTLLASGGDDGTVRLWDPTKGQPVGEPLVGHTDLVRSICALRIGDRIVLASGSHDGTVRLWDPVTGQPHGEPLSGPNESRGVYDLCAVPVRDRMLVAAACGDGVLRLWDPAIGQQHGESLRGHAQLLYAVCVVPAGDRMLLASAGRGETIRLWDPATGTTAGVALAGHTGWIMSLCAVPVGGEILLASAGVDGTIRVWGPARPDTGATLDSAAVPSRPRDLLTESPLYAIPQGTYQGVSWPDTAPEQDIHVLRGHTNALQAVCAVPAGNRMLIASASIDGTVHLWDPTTGQVRGEPLTGHDGTVSALCGVPARQRRLLASGGADGTVRFWDPSTATATGEPLETGAVFAMCLVPTDRQALLAIGDDNGTIRLWDPATGEPIGRSLTGHDGWISSLCAIRTRTQMLLASVGRDETVRLWDLETWRAYGRVPGRGVFERGHGDRVVSVCAVPTAARILLACAGVDGTIRLWDPETGRPSGDPLTGHSGAVLSLCALPLGREILLASGGEDATVRLWDPTIGQRGEALVGHSRPVNDVCAVPVGDQMLLATSSQDGTLRVWGPANGRRSLNAVLDEDAGAQGSDRSVFERRLNAALRQTEGRAFLRGDIVTWLIAFGQHMIDPEHSGVDHDEIGPTRAAIYRIWHERPEEFVAKLAAVALPEGGWAAYGAHKLVFDILSSYLDGAGRQDEHYLALFEAGMTFVLSQGYSGWDMSFYEQGLLGDIARDRES